MSRNYCKDCGSHNTAPLSKKCVLESVTSCLYEMLKYSQTSIKRPLSGTRQLAA